MTRKRAVVQNVTRAKNTEIAIVRLEVDKFVCVSAKLSRCLS